LAFACLAAGASPRAFAGDSSPVQTADNFSIVDELRFGVFAHNPIHDENAPVDASFETLSSPIGLYSEANPVLAVLLDPRINFGAVVNTLGRTSYGFGGLNWRAPIFGRAFAEGEFGAAVNDATRAGIPGRIDMGCPVTFRESGGLGYQLTSNVDIVASVEHASHAGLCGKLNPGITDFGVRVGYKF
jgi:hypothetical protein